MKLIKNVKFMQKDSAIYLWWAFFQAKEPEDEQILHEFTHHLRRLAKKSKTDWHREYIELLANGYQHSKDLWTAYWNHEEEVIARHQAELMLWDWKVNFGNMTIEMYMKYKESQNA